MKKLGIILLSLLLPMMVFGAVFGLKPIIDLKLDPNILRDTMYVPQTIEGHTWNIDEMEWLPGLMVFFEYLPYHSGRPMLERVDLDIYMWLGPFGNFVLSARYDFLEYNASQLCTELVLKLRDDSGEFVDATIVTMEYDDYDRLTKFENIAVFDDEHNGEQWMEIEYLSDNSMLILTFEQDEDYLEYQKIEIDLDNQNRMQSQTVYISDDGENWELDNKLTYSYHAQDTSDIDGFIRYLSDNFVMNMFTGNDMMYGIVTELTELDWDGQIWRTTEKHIYDYDADLLRTAKKSYRYEELDDKDDSSAGGWFHYYRNTYAYDSNGNMIEKLGEHYKEGEYIDGELLETSYMPLTDNHDLSTPAISPINVSIYPQPFAGSVSILGESKAGGELKVEVFNLRGQKVRSFNMLSGTTLTWDGKDESGKELPASVYFLRAEQGSTFQTKKLIKLK
ncbi:MAG: T9SS type A sorting domain-containing protein [Candidatus Cloacimonetes bacterium]|nr:T9SS type A sorting domain-containing protein [Candidatus Cloacimonadota bacterium]